MKVHKHLVDRVIVAWAEIFGQKRFTDKTIEFEFKNHRSWGSRDRRFFAENVYEGVRWWRRLWWILDEEESMDPGALTRLWVVLQLNLGRDLPPWVQMEERDLKELQARVREVKLSSSDLAIRESVPDWINKWGQEELGERWPGIVRALNLPAPVDLRVNTLKANAAQAIAALAESEIEAVEIPGQPSAITLSVRKNVFLSPAFKKGFFEMQDRSSQRVAPMLRVEPGQRVIDACAGAGGKSLQLAALMKNKGKILSLDIHEWKLKELQQRARRAGVDIIETRVIDSNKVIKRLAESADRVLLDVPCSGMGVLRRNPDAKWKLTNEEVVRLRETQQSLLTQYSEMLKPGGILVYATCSMMKSENQDQVDQFIASKGSQFQVIDTLSIDPSPAAPGASTGDGFFACAIQKQV